MKYYMVEGIILDAGKMDDAIMKEHMAYTQKAMDKGLILLSGLKEDMSGGIFIMKADSGEEIGAYLAEEPFKKSGVQEYKVTEFQAHYFNGDPGAWFQS